MEHWQWLRWWLRMRHSRTQCVLHGHRWKARQLRVRNWITYFARNLAHDLSCSFTNTLPFEEESRSGAPKGSQACAAGPAGHSKSGAPLAAQFCLVLAALPAAASSRKHDCIVAGSPRARDICMHLYNVTYNRFYALRIRVKRLSARGSPSSQHLNGHKPRYIR